LANKLNIIKRRDAALENEYDIVVVVVDNKYTQKLLNAVEYLGVSGSTILPGRGRGVNSKPFLLDIPIEPQRECILILAPKSKTKEVYQTAMEIGELNKPERGVVFVLDVKQVGGISFATDSSDDSSLA